MNDNMNFDDLISTLKNCSATEGARVIEEFRALQGKKTPRPPDSDDFWYEGGVGRNGLSITGKRVDEDSCLKLSTVWACVHVISETCGSLPLYVYKYLDNGKEKATYHNLFNLLHLQPNQLSTSMQFREALVSHLLLWGNSYAQIIRDGTGKILSLWLLDPSKMNVTRPDGDLVYEYTTTKGEKILFTRNDIFHVAGLGYSGLTGYSVLGYMREVMALGLAGEEFGSRFFENNATPRSVIEHPGKLSDDVGERLRTAWNSTYGGLANSNKTAILEEGMTLKPISVNPEDAQFIQLRRFQVEEICRIFRVPPHLVQELSHGTYSNIEHQSIDFVMWTIRPWLIRIEQAIQTQLFPENERGTYFSEHIMDAILRGDTPSRYEAYSKAINDGQFSINEVRELENRNPIKGGDVHYINSTLVPLGTPPPVKAPPTPPISVETSATSGDNTQKRDVTTVFEENEELRKQITRQKMDKIIRRMEIQVKRDGKMDKEDIEKFKEEILGE